MKTIIIISIGIVYIGWMIRELLKASIIDDFENEHEEAIKFREQESQT